MCCPSEKTDAMRTDFPSLPSLSTANDSTTGPISGIDSPCMTKAALYARGSTDAQQKEGTIESQLVELKRQITVAGYVLAEEYIDDGYTGTLLDRPALNRMRADLKTDRFDRIYFLAADRIARDVETSGSSSANFSSTASRSRSTARATSRTRRTS